MPWLPTTSSSQAMSRLIGATGNVASSVNKPTCTCRPRLRSERIEFAKVALLPKASRDTSAPRPVSPCIAAGMSPKSLALRIASAPNCSPIGVARSEHRRQSRGHRRRANHHRRQADSAAAVDSHPHSLSHSTLDSNRSVSGCHAAT